MVDAVKVNQDPCQTDSFLEAERQRLYMLANELGFHSKAVLKQSRILDEYIVEAMKQ